MKYTILQPRAIYELGHRSNQEDSIFPAMGTATTEDRLFIVCDGMGGHQKGEVASGIVCKSLSDFVKAYTPAGEIFTDSQFRDGLAATAADLRAAVQAPGDEQMGTTLVFLYFHRGGCFAAHIGDSRYYHFRPTTGEIVYRSKDHSLVTELYESGELTKAEQMTADCRNILTRAMMPLQPPQPDIVHITDIQPGDWFCLFTDGIYEDLTDSELLSIISDLSLSDAQKVERLRQLTADNSDNHSGYMIHIADVEREPLDSEQPDDEAEARAAHKAFNDNSPEREAEIVTVAEPMPVEADDDVTIVGPPPTRPAPAKPAPAEPVATQPTAAATPQQAPQQPSPQPRQPQPAQQPTQQPAYQQQQPVDRRLFTQTKFLWGVVAVLVAIVAFLLWLTLSKNDKSEHYQGPREQTERSLETPKDNEPAEENAESKSPNVIYKDIYIDDSAPATQAKPSKQQSSASQTQSEQTATQTESQPEKTPAPSTAPAEPAANPQPATPAPQPAAPATPPAENGSE